MSFRAECCSIIQDVLGCVLEPDKSIFLRLKHYKDRFLKNFKGLVNNCSKLQFTLLQFTVQIFEHPNVKEQVVVRHILCNMYYRIVLSLDAIQFPELW